MNVSEEPEQVGLVPEVSAIETAGVTAAFTVTLMVFELAVVGLAQDELEVIVQLTT